MKRWIHLGGALTLALAVTACAGDRGTDVDDATVPEGGAVGTSGAMDADREFVEEQLAMGRAEVETSRLAQQRATNPQVKEFASMIVQDHQAANDKLRQIAGSTQAGETGYGADADRPVGTSGTEADMHEDFREELSELSGREFDQRYIEHMIEDHEKAIRELEDKANNAGNSQVQQWASETLPKIRQHLDRAKQIQSQLENNRSS